MHQIKQRRKFDSLIGFVHKSVITWLSSNKTMFKICANVVLVKIKTIISNSLYENWNYSDHIIMNKETGVKLRQI